MTIARFAEAGGVGIETVRFYHRRGLLPLPRVSAGKYREYDQDLLRRLRFVRRAQMAGFTLAEIRELLKLDRTQDRERIRALATARLEDLSQHLRELRDVRRSLEALIGHCETAPAAHACPIIDSFDNPLRQDRGEGHGSRRRAPTPR
jgi:MerR family mercuric resistance operon transcriptional regulator